MLYFLTIVLGLTTLLLCYAGYIFLIVDKRQDKQILENPELYDELDDKEYHFIMPAEIDEYEETRASKPTDKCDQASHRPPRPGLACPCGGSLQLPSPAPHRSVQRRAVPRAA